MNLRALHALHGRTATHPPEVQKNPMTTRWNVVMVRSGLAMLFMSATSMAAGTCVTIRTRCRA